MAFVKNVFYIVLVLVNLGAVNTHVYVHVGICSGAVVDV